jgi:type IV pilus assembly protein PilM
MNRSFRDIARIEFAPPSYLSLPTAGIDISASGVKFVVLKETHKGIVLSEYAEEPLPLGAIDKNEIVDFAALSTALTKLVKKFGFVRANITLSESHGYLFETSVQGTDVSGWCTQVEQHLDEYIPLPAAEIVFDIVPYGSLGEKTDVIGVGYPRRVVEKTESIFQDAHITVRAIESETFALPRALLQKDSTDTVLIVDIGKATTKLLIVSKRLPRFATTIEEGGHAITLAAQKYFGVTEEGSKKVKTEFGLSGGEGKEAYDYEVGTAVAAIRDEIKHRLEYWQSRATIVENYAPVTRVLLVGGNAAVRGLAEFLAAALGMPVELGDVFANMASKEDWLPSLNRIDSLAYGTAIGLALREYES